MIQHLRSFFSAHHVSGGDQQGSDPSEHQQEPAPYPYGWATALIGWVLQGGVLISAAVMLIGIILLPTRPGGLTSERLLCTGKRCENADKQTVPTMAGKFIQDIGCQAKTNGKSDRQKHETEGWKPRRPLSRQRRDTYPKAL